MPGVRVERKSEVEEPREQDKASARDRGAQPESQRLSKLFRNVPIINYLEMSPFQLLCSRWKCALERSPVVRAKRKCAFQRAAVRLPGWGPVAACSGIPVATGDLSWLCESRWDAVLTDAAQGTSVPVP